MRHLSHLNTAKSILTKYHGPEPFHLFLKNYFKADKKYGSRDRKSISQLCYGYFRLGWVFRDKTMDEKILLGLYYTSTESNELLEAFDPTLNKQAGLPLNEKINLQGHDEEMQVLFPFTDRLSEGIEAEKFSFSHLQQPDLFLRLRPGKESIVKSKFDKHNVSYKEIGAYALSLANSSKLDGIISLDEEAVIQDLSSQRTGDLLMVEELFSTLFSSDKLPSNDGQQKIKKVWDCCAASGGKSIMVWDLLPAFSLTVSDLRGTILENLENRFYKAGIKSYNRFIADLTKKFTKIDLAKQDLIIADLPCTGSGTWSRNPEHLYQFNQQSIAEYSERQKSIIAHIIPYLENNGHILYITCSVFKDENELIVAHAEKKGLTCLRSGIIAGYEQRADTMFAALLQKKKAG